MLGTGKHPNVRRAKHRAVIDPLLDHGDLRVAFRTVRQNEIVADGRAADLDAAQERVTFEFHQVIRRHVFRKEVGRQFGAVAALVGAVIDKIEKVDSE